MEKEFTVDGPSKIKIKTESDGGFVVSITPIVSEAGDTTLDAVE